MRRKLLIANRAVIEALDACLSGYVFVYSSKSIDYSAYLYDQPGFTIETNPELFELLEQIEEILSPLGPVTLSSEDDANENIRRFLFSVEKLSVSINVVLAPESPSCQRQITGYEEIEEWKRISIKVTRPIYKFVC